MLTCLKCIDLAMFGINVLLNIIAKACLLYIIVLPIKSMSVIYKSVVHKSNESVVCVSAV